MAGRRNQYLGALSMLLMDLSFGAMSGWNAPSFPTLMSEEEAPLESGPLTTEEVSWIAALVCPGGVAATLLFGWLVDVLSRKTNLFIIGVLQIVAWLLVVIADHYLYIYASKFLAGFSGAGVFLVGTLYITEIAETQIRGFLGSLFYLCWNLGMCLMFVAGAYLHCMVTPWLFVPLSVLFMVILAFLPDTPFYYASRGDMKEAERSLRFYRGQSSSSDSSSFNQEFQELKVLCKSDEKGASQAIQLKDFTTKPAIRSIVMGFVMYFLNPMCGCFAMLNYTTQIFEQAGSSLSPTTSTIVVGVIQVFGTYMAALLVERMGRKVLIVVSGVGTCLGQAVFGTYFYLSGFYDLSSFSLVPLVTFSFVVFITNCGVLNLPFVLLPELVPVKIRSAVTTLCYCVLNFTSFSILKFLPAVMENFGFHVPFYAFSLACGLGSLHYLTSLPETKGKSLVQIQDDLSR